MRRHWRDDTTIPPFSEGQERVGYRIVPRHVYEYG